MVDLQLIVETLQEFASLRQWTISADQAVDRLRSSTVNLVSSCNKAFPLPLLYSVSIFLSKLR